jgi:6-pyruvoyltetrahydropterin/6-carboxytetrahydropterin synthase
MKISIMRTLEFDAAHRVMHHESKCANMHGHRYKVEIHARAAELDPLGRIIDFSAIKARIGGWIDTHWDHTTILHENDPSVRAWQSDLIPFNKPIYLMPENPTAENMAKYLLAKCNDELMLGTAIEVYRVVIWETPNCKAEAALLI